MKSAEALVSPNEKPKSSAKITSARLGGLKLSELLSKRRRQLELELDSVERSTHIRRKYLELIEAGDYANLPNDVYSRGYVKNYAEELGFDTTEILKIYSRERHEYDMSLGSAGKTKKIAGLKPIGSQSYSITPRTILVALTSIFVLVMVIYVGWQFSQLSTPPSIRLSNADKSSTTSSYAIVSGEVDTGSDVFINDSPILSAPDGSFSDRVMLVNGSNQIKVSARNKFGKETTKTIVVDAKTTSNDSSLPVVRSTVFDGVELVVTAGPQAIYIITKIDGKEAFKGTMLPGSKQLFQAKQSIRITTGNAGSTSVVLTNSVVANKSIGSLGPEGESKQDIIFNKDTSVQ